MFTLISFAMFRGFLEISWRRGEYQKKKCKKRKRDNENESDGLRKIYLENERGYTIIVQAGDRKS